VVEARGEHGRREAVRPASCPPQPSAKSGTTATAATGPNVSSAMTDMSSVHPTSTVAR
jgi:hypothetical protein